MFEWLINALKVPESRRRLLITFALLTLYRLGIFIPLPGIDLAVLFGWFEEIQETVIGSLDLFSGEVFKDLSIFALGIMPYLSATIILQLLSICIPNLAKLSRDEKGMKRMNRYTIKLTILISLIQSLGLSFWMQGQSSIGGPFIVTDPGLGFHLVAILTLTSGTLLLLLLAHLINRYGIGNGISLIILAGIVSRIPSAAITAARRLFSMDYTIDNFKPFPHLFIAGVILLAIASVVVMWLGHRKVPVQYRGKEAHLPFHISQTGFVIPITFASALLSFPATLLSFFGEKTPLLRVLVDLFNRGGIAYLLLYAAIIIYFTYLYAAITTNPDSIAKTMEEYGLSIPDCPAGEQTADHLEGVLTRIVLIWALFIVVIALLPDLSILWGGVPFYFGGSSLIIVVAIILDTFSYLKQGISVKSGEVEHVKLTEVFSHTDTVKAWIFKILLESEGIKVSIYGETYGKLLGLNWGPLAEKKIMVRKEDYEKACNILASLTKPDQPPFINDQLPVTKEEA